MKKIPKISIVTINYNNAVGLEKTIKSVVNQKSTNIEYLVIDGGSNDGSGEVINKYSGSINYFVLENDNGVYNAMNKGIRASSGDYLLFLNSGDFLIDENVIESAILLGMDTDLVSGNMIYNNNGAISDKSESGVYKILARRSR